MTSLLPAKTGYLRAINMEHSVGRFGESVSLVFIHTEDPLRKAIACVPVKDAHFEWPVEVFLRFNTDYPEALDHIEDMAKYAHRLADGQT